MPFKLLKSKLQRIIAFYWSCIHFLIPGNKSVACNLEHIRIQICASDNEPGVASQPQRSYASCAVQRGSERRHRATSHTDLAPTAGTSPARSAVT